MTDHEMDQLGRQFVLRLRITGLHISNNPSGSLTDKRGAKRAQHAPPVPLMPSTASSLSTPSLIYLPFWYPSSEASVQDGSLRTASSHISDSVPSLVDLFRSSDGSSCSTQSSAQSFANTSSNSSLLSLRRSATKHMPYTGSGGVALIAENARAQGAVSGMGAGFTVTRTVFLHTPPRWSGKTCTLPKLKRMQRLGLMNWRLCK